MMNPYAFIVGCPRSGTTLLQRLVNAHATIAIMPEAPWIPRKFRKESGLTSEGMVTADLIPQLLEHPKFSRLGFDQDQLLTLVNNGRPVSYSSFVSRVFDLFGKRKGKELVGNKTPGFVRKIESLHRLWAEARFVHLIRDGRDVYLSMINRPLHHVNRGPFNTWAQDPVTTAALWWELSVKRGRQAGSSLRPGLYCEIRYESLVAHPAEECAALCAFLGLPYQEGMLRFHERRKRAAPPSDAKQAWLPSEGESEFRLRPITPGLRDWRSQMPQEDVERFEAATGGLLDELAYPRAFPRSRPERLEHASRIRHLFALDPRGRGMEREGPKAN
jgi:Sulfotransferase family